MSSVKSKKSYINPKQYIDDNGYKIYEFYTKGENGKLIKHINKNWINEKFLFRKKPSNINNNTQIDYKMIDNNIDLSYVGLSLLKKNC